MILFIRAGKLEVLWKVATQDFSEIHVYCLFELRLQWDKHIRGWKMLWHGQWPPAIIEGFYSPRLESNDRLEFSRTINGKTCGWALQGPIARIY